MRDGTTLSPSDLKAYRQRSAAICEACCELEQAADALQAHIVKHDETGSIKFLSRAMLARVTALSEAICMMHDSAGPHDKDSDLFAAASQVIYGAEPPQDDNEDDQPAISGASRQAEASNV